MFKSNNVVYLKHYIVDFEWVNCIVMDYISKKLVFKLGMVAHTIVQALRRLRWEDHLSSEVSILAWTT
jgi:hypothetical protein